MGERKLMAKMSDQELQAQGFLNQENILILQQDVTIIRNELSKRCARRAQEALEVQAEKDNAEKDLHKGNGQAIEKSLKSAMKKMSAA